MTDEAKFRAALERDGYTVVDVEWAAGTVNPTHTHDFTARGLCVSGGFTVETEDGPRHCGPGDTFDMAAGRVHAETVGPDGARLIVGRR